jgi:hypothetical protein
MGTRVLSNGIELGYVQTEHMEMTPVLSDNGTEYLYTQVTYDNEQGFASEGTVLDDGRVMGAWTAEKKMPLVEEPGERNL